MSNNNNTNTFFIQSHYPQKIYGTVSLTMDTDVTHFRAYLHLEIHTSEKNLNLNLLTLPLDSS